MKLCMKYEKAYNKPLGIETERLSLRKITLKDTDSVYRLLSTDEVTRYSFIDTFVRRKQAADFIRTFTDKFSTGRGIRWVILDKKTNAFVGTIAYRYLYKYDLRGEIGYILAKEHWGNRYIPEILPGIIEFGFRNLGLRRIEAVVSPDNIRSIKILRKAGFKKEGYFRHHQYWKRKSWDVIPFALLKEDWEKAKS